MTRRPIPPIVLLAVAATLGCGEPTVRPDVSAPAMAPGATSTTPWFSAVTDSGVDFEHFAGIAGRLYFPELVGSGGALFDYDGDGDLDLFAVQGTRLGEAPDADLRFPPPARPGDRLYRNDTAGAGAPIRFTDVTDESGVGGEGYGMGAAVGDIDRDGHWDLYVSRLGSDTLWRNRGDGTFEDWTLASGVVDPRWSTGAAFLDLDGDGDHDLWVTHYVDYRPGDDVECRSPSGLPDYCGPLTYPPAGDRLLRNRGDGTFEDLSAALGLERHAAPGFGAIGFDADEDGRLDVYVANDERPNHLWHNLGGGRFEEVGLRSGVAVNADGVPEASMGLAATDVDGDGREDVISTHLDQESHTLWLAAGGGFYVDRTRAWGLVGPTTEVTGFGVALEDFDGDARPDLLAVNGAVRLLEGLAVSGAGFPYHQRDQLFRQRSNGGFELLGAEESGAVSAPSTVSRGLASGDLDGDGDRDVVIFDNSGGLRILRNEVGQARPWIGLRIGERLPDGRLRDALGAWVGVVRQGAPTLWRRIRTEGGYLTANDPRLQLGLGEAAVVERVEVRWPGGDRERWIRPEAHRYHALVRGEGTAVEDAPGVDD